MLLKCTFVTRQMFHHGGQSKCYMRKKKSHVMQVTLLLIWVSLHQLDLGVTPYLHDTVTSILVAGTLVLRGSNSPIDAIISTQHANKHPQRKKEGKRKKKKRTDHSQQDRDCSKSIVELSL